MDETTIEPAIELPPGFDSGEGWRVHGRLILREDGLFFIHGWDEQGIDLWRALDSLVSRFGDRAREARAGQVMLDEYAARSADEQAEIVPRSRVVPRDDISSAEVRGLAPKLRVETRRHGTRLVFRIPRAAREAAQAWAQRF